MPPPSQLHRPLLMRLERCVAALSVVDVGGEIALGGRKWCFQQFLRDTAPLARSEGGTTRLNIDTDPLTRPGRWRHLHASGDSQLTAGFTFTAKLVPLLTRPCPRRPLSQPRRLSWRATKCALLTRIRRAASDFSKQFLFIGLLDEDRHPAAGRRADGDGGWKHDPLL